MTKMTYIQAMMDAVISCMEADATIRVLGGTFARGRGLSPEAEKTFFTKFAARILQPPISEGATAALGVGAAMAGLRPFVNFGTSTFAFEAWNQIVNEAANAHFMSGGQVDVPVIFHMFAGIRGQGGVQHSQSPQSMFANCPGLQVLLPGSPADINGLIRTAFRQKNPCVIVNHTKLLQMEGEVPAGDHAVPFGVAEVKRPGKDVTIVATSIMVPRALEAAEDLAREGIDAEVLDPRTAVPLDRAAISAAAARTGRLVVADEASSTCSLAAEIIASVAEAGIALKSPPVRVARPDVPVAYSPPLEAAVTPDAAAIAAGVRRALAQVH